MKRYILLSSILFLIIAAACEPKDDSDVAQSPPTVITLLPPFLTQTPRYTATLPPSATPTASDTPTVTATGTPITPTSTPTTTATPPVLAAVDASNNINVRDEPSRSGTVLTLLEPGKQVEVHFASEDGEWLQVRFIDDTTGLLVEGWMGIEFLNVLNETWIAPTLGPSPTPSPTLDPLITPSATPTITPTPEVPPGPDVSDKNVRANCRQTQDTPPRIAADETVAIWWNWFVTQSDLMESNIASANYEVLLDGVLLTDYGKYQTEMVRERDGNWYVHWYYPVGTLAAGRHEVTYRVTWTTVINDGKSDFGPGTESEFEEGNCVFTVTE